jgi:hypothetical protein
MTMGLCVSGMHTHEFVGRVSKHASQAPVDRLNDTRNVDRNEGIGLAELGKVNVSCRLRN